MPISLTSTGRITDGLVMYLQTGNPRSYIGSGSIWNDINGGDNNVTLLNTPTYNSTDSGGSLQFNGTNQYGTFPLTGIPTGSASRTLSVWINTLSNGAGGAVLTAIGYGNASSGAGCSLAVYNGEYVFSGYGSDVYGGTVTTNTWLNLVGVYNGVTAFLYLNGSLLGSALRTWNTGTDGATIAAYPGPQWYFQGRIAEVSVYNIPLTETQLLRNYNATRRRFGV